MKNLREQALKGTFWSTVQQAGDKGLRLLIHLILARLLTPEAFGLVALALVYIDFAAIFLNQGLGAAIVQREAIEEDHLHSAFWGNMVLGILMLGVGFASADLIASATGQAELAPVVRWLSFCFFFNGLTIVQDGLLRRVLDFRSLAVRVVGGQAAAGVVAVSMALAGAGVWSLVALTLIRQVVGTALLWAASSWRPRLRFSWRRYRELLGYGLSVVGIALINFLRTRADNLLIGLVLGAASLGYYSVARQIVNGVFALVSGSVSPVISATLARLQREPLRLERAIYQSAEIQGLLIVPVFLGMAAVAPELVPALIGDGWDPAVPVVSAMALVALVRSTELTSMIALMSVGEVAWRVRLEILLGLTTLAAIVIALPAGIAAVAWASAAASLLLLPLALYVSARILPISLTGYLKRFAAPAAGSLLMLGAVFLLRATIGPGWSPGLTLGALTLAGAAAYAGFMLVAARSAAQRAIADLKAALFRRGGATRSTQDGRFDNVDEP